MSSTLYGKIIMDQGPRRDHLGSQHEDSMVATREAALLEFPMGMEVCRELKDKGGNIILSRGKICDFYDPYWRVESVTETGRS